MSEYNIELQDSQGTAYGHVDKFGNEIYYEDLEEARLDAKNLLTDRIVLVRIFDDRGRLSDFFKA